MTRWLPKKTHAIDPATGRWRTDSDGFWLRFPDDLGQPLATRKSKALQLRDELLSCDTLDDLQQVKQRWGESWCKIAFNRLLTISEQNRLRFASSVRSYSDEWEEIEPMPNV